jgi:copper chaperone CopZ
MGTGLEDLEKVKKLKNTLLGMEGVTKVEITLPKRVSVAYDPTKIPTSVINSIMSTFGLKPSG